MIDDQKNNEKALTERVRILENKIASLTQATNENDLLDSVWIKNLDNWLWDIQNDSILVNDHDVVKQALDNETSLKKHSLNFYASRIHPDDYDKVRKRKHDHLQGKTDVYLAQYRMLNKDDEWRWIYDRGVVTRRDNTGKPLMMAGIAFDFTEDKLEEITMRDKNEELLHLLQTDYLTGALNRRTIFRKLHNEMEKADYHQTPLALILFDIDDFKWINDTYGHLHGDNVLIMIVQTAKNILGSKGYVGRYGGEEFLLVLPETTEEKARGLAEDIRKTVRNLSIENGCLTTMSLGISMYNGEDIDSYVDQADQAMYLAKRQGKDQVVCYSEVVQ